LNKDFDKFILEDYDELTIHTIPNWTERKVITLNGEVKFPGNYVIESGDRLSDVIKRAGGYTKSAFLDGALFTRDSIKILQQTKMRQAILELKQKAISMSTSPAGMGQGDTKIDTASLVNMIDTLSKEAEKLSPIGRISINLDSNLSKFINSTSNLVLKDKDTLTIPSFNDTILVIGEIMNSTSIIFQSTNADDYISDTGGLNQRADEDNIFIVHANGSATKIDNGWFSDASTKTIKRGDTIIVPRELVTYTGMQIAKDISSILYQFALTAASLSVVGAL
jgi:protein involved in polysaccharide export with SLBB domain